jgi:hypothetical protein
MNFWLIFWTLMLVVAGGSFAVITLVVTTRGFRDLRQWFATLSRQNTDQCHAEGAPAGRDPL